MVELDRVPHQRRDGPGEIDQVVRRLTHAPVRPTESFDRPASRRPFHVTKDVRARGARRAVDRTGFSTEQDTDVDRGDGAERFKDLLDGTEARGTHELAEQRGVRIGRRKGPEWFGGRDKTTGSQVRSGIEPAVGGDKTGSRRLLGAHPWIVEGCRVTFMHKRTAARFLATSNRDRREACTPDRLIEREMRL